MQVGDVVYLRNIIFEGREVDHAFDKGRPCVYIGDIDDKMYFVPLTNTSTMKYKVPIIISPNKRNGLRKECHPNFKQIIEKRTSFYEVFGYLTEQEMIKFFEDALLYLSEIRRETDNICIELAKEYLDKHNVKYKDKDIVKQDKKKK